jgi:molybdopterin molybdotransferase
MKNPVDAWDAVEKLSAPLPAVRVARAEALGRCLAEDLPATVDVPPADVSAMDGYACAGAPTVGEAVAVRGVVAAGEPPPWQLEAGEAAKIMTGAVVPEGADRVIPVELSDGGSPPGTQEAVAFTAVEPPGKHIRRRAEVVARGAALLPAGTRLGPSAVALLATHGYAEVAVHAAPSVAVLTTGDEIVPPEEDPGPGQLRDSNSAFLVAAGRRLGLDFRHLGIAPDDAGVLRERIAEGMRSDVLLLSGGVSMGDFDLVEGVLDELGCTTLFDKVAIQPGKPLVVATHDRSERTGWVFGLPGNPGSVMVTFHLYVAPLLRRLMGLDGAFWRGARTGTLTAPLPGAKGRDRFIPAIAEPDGKGLNVRPLPPRGSHDVVAFALGNALVRVAAHSPPRGDGEDCEVLLLD